eukprot:365028-Chlamydomonas_euryale.AAC.21
MHARQDKVCMFGSARDKGVHAMLMPLGRHSLANMLPAFNMSVTMEVRYHDVAAIVLIDDTGPGVDEVLGGKSRSRRHTAISAGRNMDCQVSLDARLPARRNQGIVCAAACESAATHVALAGLDLSAGAGAKGGAWRGRRGALCFELLCT